MAGIDDFDFDDLGGFDDLDSPSNNSTKPTNQSNSYGDLLDDSDSSSFGFDDEDEYDEDDGLGDYNNNTDGRKATKKTALVIVFSGIALVLLLFIVVGFFSSFTTSSKSSSNDKSTTSQSSSTTSRNTGSQSSSSAQKNNSTTTNSSSSSKDNWINFVDGTEITYNDNYISLNFTVTSINSYCKIVDSENNLELKTVLSGALSGMSGTYEIEVPYSMGTKLQVGDTFSVKVKLGTMSGGYTIVDEIVYG
jgi:flagellar basal body-associated protein FliL